MTPTIAVTPTITGIWGAPGTIKSTLAATWPMGLSWHEFDIGGFERGSQYLNEEQRAGIILHQYPAPLRLTLDKDGHMLEGWLELFKSFLDNVNEDCKNTAIQTIVVDTGTMCWTATHRAFLQDLQKRNNKRESLTQIEYGDVNPWFYQVVQYPKLRGKNLVMTFHDQPYYVDDGKGGTKEHPKGYVRHAGWAHFPNNADLMLHMTVRDKKPIAAIESHYHLERDDVKTGIAPLALARMQIVDPTYDKVMHLVECAKAIAAAGLPMPSEYDQVVNTGEALLHS